MKSILRIFLFISFYLTPVRPLFSQIIITEIFADPTPSRGLPEKEFVEIYNTGGNSVSLKGYTFFYAGSKTGFPDLVMLPGEYIIICRKGNEDEFRKFGKVAGLSSFSLLNSGTLLMIRDEKSEDVFSVRYASSWYSKGREQGFSLEMIDKNYHCRGKDNWTSSLSPVGATPGQPNSVDASLPDITGPVLLGHQLEGNILTLEFNEKLNSITSEARSNFDVSEGFDISAIKTDKYESEFIKLELSRSPGPNEFFELRIGRIEDCSGNVMQPAIVIGGNFLPPDSADILISEVLFNPRTGGYDFIELFNNSGKKINLKNWYFANRNVGKQVDHFSGISANDLVLGGGEYMAFTENKDVLLSHYPGGRRESVVEIPRLPALPVLAGTVILTDSDRRIYDEFSYSEDMHHPMLDDRKGVSLERVSFNVSSDNRENWKSSSSFEKFSTPGYENSQNGTNLSPLNIFYAEPVVFFPDSKAGPDKTQLKFNLMEAGYLATVKILNINGRVVKNLANNVISGINEQLEWDGTDDSGNFLPVGYYLFHITTTGSSSSGIYLVKTVLGGY